ncbi:MAG: DUF5703 domain-containing protein [Tepidisphaeraceae bacterium]
MSDLPDLSSYDVIWDTPSENASGSMPIGNGDLGANVWVEPNGDLLLLVGKTDAWDENSSLVKLGRVRVTFDPPLNVAAGFEQRLCVTEGVIRVRAGDTRVTIWADAHRPAIRVRVTSGNGVGVRPRVERWRNYPYRMTPTQTGDMFKNLTGKDLYPTIVTPDESAATTGETWVWHRNAERENDPYKINMRLQGLGDLLESMPSPLTDRTFGMAVCGDGRPTGEVTIFGLTSTSKNPDDWHAAMRALIDSDNGVSDAAFADHVDWWRAFWQRSHLVVTSETDADNAFKVTRAYVLQRFMNAAGGRGEFPIKHNGSIFTVGRPWDPDFRRWGGPGFWFMNQRLIYWPMLADGDFDLMKPWLAMYRKTLPVQLHRTQKYFGHRGAHYPETMTFWGAKSVAITAGRRSNNANGPRPSARISPTTGAVQSNSF